MKNILFRAKKTESKEWIEGSYIESVVAASPFGYITPSYPTEPTIIYTVTLGQYTGVIDKNGKKIFEGDIIAGAACWLERYKPAVVTFRNGSFGLLWHRGDIEEFDPFTSICNIEYEVVGNIYDNPELMEE